jgi:hypothetical protein
LVFTRQTIWCHDLEYDINVCIVISKGLWRWYITLWIMELFDVVHRLIL